MVECVRSNALKRVCRHECRPHSLMREGADEGDVAVEKIVVGQAIAEDPYDLLEFEICRFAREFRHVEKMQTNGRTFGVLHLMLAKLIADAGIDPELFAQLARESFN